jgi:hypothetical protein
MGTKLYEWYCDTKGWKWWGLVGNWGYVGGRKWNRGGKEGWAKIKCFYTISWWRLI